MEIERIVTYLVHDRADMYLSFSGKDWWKADRKTGGWAMVIDLETKRRLIGWYQDLLSKNKINMVGKL